MELPGISTKINIDTNPLKAGINASIGKANEFQHSFKASMTQIDTSMQQTAKSGTKAFGKMLSDLKSQFGKSSILGQIIPLLAGSGAIAALGMAAGKVREFGASIRDLSENWSTYAENQDKLTEKIASMVPVLGSVFLAVRDVESAITGSGKRAKEAVEHWEKYHDAVAKTKKLISDGAWSKLLPFSQSIQKSVDEASLAMTSDGTGKDILRAMQDSRHQAYQIKSLANDAIKSLGIEDMQKKIDEEVKLNGGTYYSQELREQLNELNKQKEDIEKARDDALNQIYNTEDVKIKAIRDNAATNEFKKIADAAAEAAKKVKDAMDDMQKQIDQFGMTDIEKKIADFSSMPNNTKEQIDAYIEAASKLRGLKASEFLKDMEKDLRQFSMSEFDKQRDNIRNNKDLNDAEKQRALDIVDDREKRSQQKDFDDRVKKFAESVKTPMQQFTEQMDFLQDALAQGKITEQQFDLGARKAREDAFGEQKLPALIRANSAESFAARYDAGRPKAEIRLDPQIKAIKEGNTKVVDKLEELKSEIARSRIPVKDMP